MKTNEPPIIEVGMESSSFPELGGGFELVDVFDGQLDDGDSIARLIAQEELHRTNWRLTFCRVQYGTFGGTPACLLVVEGKFHAEESRRHRFTWVRIKVDLSQTGDPVEVLKIAPQQAYGIKISEQRTSNWSLRWVEKIAPWRFSANLSNRS